MNFLIALSNLGIGFYIFLLTFNIIKNENKDSIIKKYNLLFKILSIILIIRGVMLVINNIANM
jgi:hypothetical protein